MPPKRKELEGLCGTCPALEMSGKQLNRAQKRQRITAELLRDPNRSDREIGRVLGVDGKTCGVVRFELGLTAEIPQKPKDGNPFEVYKTPIAALVGLLDREDFLGKTSEPAQGDGRMVKLMLARNYDVVGSDIRTGNNFLASKERFDNFVTNPPYSKTIEFIRHAKKLANKKIAMLLPLTYLSGQSRYYMVFNDRKFPLVRVWVFSDRVKFKESSGVSFVPHAWFVWEKVKKKGGPVIGWIA